jgi:two-component system chemotaxis sensor kinase CheA
MAITNEALQQQLIKDLIMESQEGLDRLDGELLALEKGEQQPDTFNIIFRVVHTIKGTAGCIGLGKIESVAHVGENLLSLLREGQLKISPALIATLLEYSDALKAIMRCLEQSGQEGDQDYSALLENLRLLQNGEPLPASPVAAEKPVETKSWGLFEEEPAAAPETPAKAVPVAPAATPVSRPAPSVSDTAIRVEVGQLDKLMNLVGELVLARNQILQFTSEFTEPTLLNAAQRLNIITTELQENVMKTRMQPIENIWAKFPRIVRDVACELGKKVRLVMEGNETELDRTIIEAIKDPLMHIIRNSMDHGFEKPEVRVAAGKPAEGVLLLRAFHEGGQVNIEIMDDGDGINVARVRQKAVEKGLVTLEAAGRMTEREVFNLIFLPGFSTAEKVTNVSGRGVGMDVVKTNIEKIGGSVDILSKAGQGTTLKIKIPLTLAIIPALIVTSGGERFAIPQVSLLELVRLEVEQAHKHIELLYGSAVYRLRGQLLPLVYLNRELKLGETGSENATAAVQIVVVQADGRQFGMIVDEINDTEEIVVKPLSKQLKGIACFAGATIMGDGRVALILDVMGLAQYAKVISEIHDRALSEQAKNQGQAGEKQSFLVFDVGTNAHMAIALSAVARLEEFPRQLVERAGGQEVVQYRGQILPLIRVASFLPDGGKVAAPADPMQVVVYSEQGRSVGLVVEKICDIVEETLQVRRDQRRAGIAGSAVIQDKVTDLLDVPGIIRAANTDFYTETKENP